MKRNRCVQARKRHLAEPSRGGGGVIRRLVRGGRPLALARRGIEIEGEATDTTGRDTGVPGCERTRPVSKRTNAQATWRGRSASSTRAAGPRRGRRPRRRRSPPPLRRPPQSFRRRPAAVVVVVAVVSVVSMAAAAAAVVATAVATAVAVDPQRGQYGPRGTTAMSGRPRSPPGEAEGGPSSSTETGSDPRRPRPTATAAGRVPGVAAKTAVVGVPRRRGAGVILAAAATTVMTGLMVGSGPPSPNARERARGAGARCCGARRRATLPGAAGMMVPPLSPPTRSSVTFLRWRGACRRPLLLRPFSRPL